MDRFDDYDALDNSNERLPSKRESSSRKKRKWREIEVLKDRYQLMQELRAIDLAFDRPIDDLKL